MAYCYLEEAWGDNYKSFLSPASITPASLGKCKEMEKIKGPTNKQSNGTQSNESQSDQIEHFASIDNDLRVDYDEFNLPLHWDAPQGINTMDDDYYRLINESNEGVGPGDIYETFKSPEYVEENQFNSTFTQECAQAFPTHVQYHLKKCIECRKRIRKLLKDFDNIDNDLNNEKTSIDKTSIDKTSIEKTSIEKTSIEKRFLPKGPFIDLLVFIAFGVFVIFILDAFVRLGKHLK